MILGFFPYHNRLGKIECSQAKVLHNFDKLLYMTLNGIYRIFQTCFHLNILKLLIYSSNVLFTIAKLSFNSKLTLWHIENDFYIVKWWTEYSIHYVMVYTIWLNPSILLFIIAWKKNIHLLVAKQLHTVREGVKNIQRGGGPSNILPKAAKPWPPLKILRRTCPPP